MSYFKIDNNDYSSCVNELKVKNSVNYNAQTNAAAGTHQTIMTWTDIGNVAVWIVRPPALCMAITANIASSRRISSSG